MISKTTPTFWRCLARLTSDERDAARASFRLFTQNPGHNSLRFKKLSGFQDVWSARASRDIRAAAHRDGDTVTWVWIGPHKEFDRLFG